MKQNSGLPEAGSAKGSRIDGSGTTSGETAYSTRLMARITECIIIERETETDSGREIKRDIDKQTEGQRARLTHRANARRFGEQRNSELF